MAVNKVVLGDEVLLDLTSDTATAADVAQGKTFHLSTGVQATGTSSGGVSYTTITVTLTVAGWSNNSQTVSASPVTTTNDIIVAPAPASASDWASGGVLCTEQAAGTLTFTCTTTPTAAITVNVMIFTGAIASASGVSF